MEMFDVEDFRQHAEMCLKEACSIDELTVDEDGDWPIVVRGVTVYVRVIEEGGLFVHVFARIAEGVIPEASAARAMRSRRWPASIPSGRRQRATAQAQSVGSSGRVRSET